MKNKILFSILTMILIILFSGACKSKPAPVAQAPRVTTTAAASPAPTVPPAATVTTTSPGTTTGNTYGGTSSGSAYNRHQSGIILDGAISYTVVRGDTLNGIAKQHYRDGSLYPLIMMVSGNIADPDQILPQMRLTIPALRGNMDDPTARQSINRYFLQIANIEDQRGRPRTAALIRGHTRQ